MCVAALVQGTILSAVRKCSQRRSNFLRFLGALLYADDRMLADQIRQAALKLLRTLVHMLVHMLVHARAAVFAHHPLFCRRPVKYT